MAVRLSGWPGLLMEKKFILKREAISKLLKTLKVLSILKLSET